MSRRLVSRFPLPHVAGVPSQARAANRAIDALTDDANERAVLRAFVDHANGGGICFVTVARIAHQAGISSSQNIESWNRAVQRVCRRLERKGLLERYPSLRTSKYAAHLPYRARQGNGPNYWRLGGPIRERAGYAEVDVAEMYRHANAVPQSASMSLPRSAVAPEDTPSLPPVGFRADVTADLTGLSPPSLQSLLVHPPADDVTPRTENGKASGEERLVPSGSEVRGTDSSNAGHDVVECLICDQSFDSGEPGSALLRCRSCVARGAT
jgi:hypothetical protein